VQQVCGLLNFYRKFIPNYAIVSRPITKLLTKDDIIWGKEENTCLIFLLNELNNECGLRLPNYNDKFICTTDYSGHGVSAVLS
jgi:hypothetical protein